MGVLKTNVIYNESKNRSMKTGGNKIVTLIIRGSLDLTFTFTLKNAGVFLLDLVQTYLMTNTRVFYANYLLSDPFIVISS
jgi:hypothetical protein